MATCASRRVLWTVLCVQGCFIALLLFLLRFRYDHIPTSVVFNISNSQQLLQTHKHYAVTSNTSYFIASKPTLNPSSVRITTTLPPRRTRILIWVMTSGLNIRKRAGAVKRTWGKRADIILYMSERDEPSLPAVGLKVKAGREHLTAKTMRAFDYVYRHYYDAADWFMKADDDTYVLVDNLRRFLHSKDPSRPVFYGHPFTPYVRPQGYFSGGAGYVLSRAALQRFGRRAAGACAEAGDAEDVDFGRCMQRLRVRAGDARDSRQRYRFHCFDIETHVNGWYPEWYAQYVKYGVQKGVENLSEESITFHYISPDKMRLIDRYLYPNANSSGYLDSQTLKRYLHGTLPG